MSYSKALCCQPQGCYPDICPQPYIDVCNEPCVTSCGDSTAVVSVPPVYVKFPGPTIATCPQNSFVGTSFPNLPMRPGGVYGSSGVFSGSFGSGDSSSGGFGGVYNSGYGAGYNGGFGGGYGGGYGGGCSGGYGGVYSGSYGRSCGGGFGGRFRGGYGDTYGYGGPCGYGRRSQSSISISGRGYSGHGNCGPC